MLDCIKNFFKQKSFHEEMNDKHRKIINYHFDNMEWNIQTTTYNLLTRLFCELDEEYLKDIAHLYTNNGDINNITIQLEDAIMDVLKHRKLIKES